MIKDLQSRIVERGITFELTPAASDWLGREGFDPVYGARPLRRAIQRFLENPLSKGILAGDFKEGNHIIVDAGGTGLSLSKAVALAV
jgi:ATP-dependent Clp protease ATP-binding subunit ClpA